MTRLAAAAVLFVATSALAGSTPGQESAEQRELREDICAATQFASCGRAPNAICHASDGIPDSELAARWARVAQLCRRYKDRFGKWLDNGCCDYVRRLDPEERAESAANFKASLEADRKLASLHPDQREQPCAAFLKTYGYWPDSCSNAGLAPPGGQAQESENRRP